MGSGTRTHARRPAFRPPEVRIIEIFAVQEEARYGVRVHFAWRTPFDETAFRAQLAHDGELDRARRRAAFGSGQPWAFGDLESLPAQAELRRHVGAQVLADPQFAAWYDANRTMRRLAFGPGVRVPTPLPGDGGWTELKLEKDGSGGTVACFVRPDDVYANLAPGEIPNVPEPAAVYPEGGHAGGRDAGCPAISAASAIAAAELRRLADADPDGDGRGGDEVERGELAY